jgi:hypothetical protein
VSAFRTRYFLYIDPWDWCLSLEVLLSNQRSMERLQLETTASRGLYRVRLCPSIVIYRMGGRWLARPQTAYACAAVNPTAWLAQSGLSTASFDTLQELCWALAEAHQDTPLPQAQFSLPSLVKMADGNYSGMNDSFRLIRGNNSNRWRLYQASDLVNGGPLRKRVAIGSVHTLQEARRWMRYVRDNG